MVSILAPIGRWGSFTSKGFTVILDTATAQSIAYRYYDPGQFEVIAESNVGETRWGVVSQTVFQNKEDGVLYAFEWEQGATETQDYDEFEMRDEFEATPVQAVEVIVTEYHPI